MTSGQYTGWAVNDLISLEGFKPLEVEFPELLPRVRGFDAVLAASRFARRWYVPFGAAVVFAFKRADDLSFTETMAELDRVYSAVPKPGQLEAFDFYGALVLVFERPVAAAKRDRLIGLRRASLFSRRIADILVVELDAGTVWSAEIPALMRRFIEPLNVAMGHRTDPPAPPAVTPGAGQRGRRATVALAGIALGAVLAAIHLAVHVPEKETLLLRLVRFGANNTPLAEAGEKWRLVTANFLHFNWEHILGNCIGLFEYARAVELLFGPGWLLALFVLTGTAGNAASNAFQPSVCGAGASGAVFGLAGVLVGVYILRRDRLSFRFRGHFWGAALVFCSYQLVMGFLYGENIGNWAHLGGLLTGLAVGLVLPFREGPREPLLGRWWGLAAVAVSVVAALAAAARARAPEEAYVPVVDRDVRASYERPAGWLRKWMGDGRLRVSDFLGGSVVFEYRENDMRGIFDWSDEKMAATFEEHHRKIAAGRIAAFECGLVSFGGGKAIQVRFRVPHRVRERTIFQVSSVTEWDENHEVLYLPAGRGVLIVTFFCLARDAFHYDPIFRHVKGSVRSLESPVEESPP